MSELIDKVQDLINKNDVFGALSKTPLEFLQEIKSNLIENFDPDEAYEFLQLLFLSLAARVGSKTKLDELGQIYELGIEVESFYNFILRFHYEYYLFLRDKGKHEEAYHYLYTYYENQLENCFDELENVEIYRKFSEDLVKLDRYDEAYEYLFEAEKMMDIFIQINAKENAITLAKIERQISLLFMHDSFYDRALEYCENEEDLLLYMISKDVEFDRYLLAANYYRQAICHQELKQYSPILPLLDKAYSVLQKLLEDEYIRELKANIFGFKYQVHNHFNQLVEAEENLVKSIYFRKGIELPNNQIMLAEDLYNLGKLYQNNHRYEKSIVILKESADSFLENNLEDAKTLYYLARISHSLGQIYLDKQDDYLLNLNFLEAVNYYQKCVEIDEQEYQGDLIRCCIELGDYYFKRKDNDDAISIYEIPLNYLNQLIKNNVSTAFKEYAHIVGYLSQVYYRKKEYDKTIEWGENALNFYNYIYKKVYPNDFKVHYDITKVVAQSYLKKQDVDKAINYYEKGIELLRDIFNSNKSEVLTLLVDLLDNLIAVLEKNNQRKKEVDYLEQMLRLTENKKNKVLVKYHAKALKKLKAHKS
ncbi:MAG: hypothetical protein WCY80_02885 [Candidatus Izemoplasmatales bacterium]